MDKILMHGTIFKNSKGKYSCVLSDDSIDRQEEIVGKSFFEDSIKRSSRIRMMMNHENNILMRIGDWVNQRIEKVNGHNALVAEPRFFMSNPNSKIIKGMLDEGAELDLSIGAQPFSSTDFEMDGKTYKKYTKGEIYEASYVGIGANKNSTSRMIAKSLGLIDEHSTEIKDVNKDIEVIKVEKDDIKELLGDFAKQIKDDQADFKKEIKEMIKEEPEPEPAPAPVVEPVEPQPEQPTEAEKALKIEVENLKTKNKELESVHKLNQAESENNDAHVDMTKSLPIMHVM